MEHILEETLSTILVQLADFFGTTTAAIQAQLPHFLAEYGRYYTLTEIPWYVGIGTFIFIIFAGCWGVLYYEWLDGTKNKSFMIILVIIAVVVYFLAIGLPIVTCLIAPEFVGAEALIKELTTLTQR